MLKITNQEWINYLSEIHADPDFWCDYNSADYGFKIREVK